jgi:methylated-DNA-[protein]-cysteine S-methyltransferase
MTTTTTKTRTMPSPIGPLVLEADDRGLVAVRLPVERHPRPVRGVPDPEHPVLVQAADELERYFAGEPVRFSADE